VSATRVAVVDLGSNSTRLLVADVAEDGTITELERASIVTRLGQGVDTTGMLAEEAMERVFAVLADYRAAIDALGAAVAVGVLTSAVRDAGNGAAFTAAVRERFGIAARTIPGEEEARLTYLGATSDRASTEPTAVIDIGGGSTEIIVGAGSTVRFHVSTQVGVVRHSERHLHHDPPAPGELQALRDDAAATFAEQVPDQAGALTGLAVAGTATQCAAMLGVDRLERGALATLLERLAAVPLEERRAVPGLDPARALTIVAGVAILTEVMSVLGLPAVDVSENDILRGAALEHSAFLIDPPQFSG
jgi:exopolyphosphatase/guanosine-5'-triphosphate,3'-diphosphate pyrophosphatase